MERDGYKSLFTGTGTFQNSNYHPSLLPTIPFPTSQCWRFKGSCCYSKEPYNKISAITKKMTQDEAIGLIGPSRQHNRGVALSGGMIHSVIKHREQEWSGSSTGTGTESKGGLYPFLRVGLQNQRKWREFNCIAAPLSLHPWEWLSPLVILRKERGAGQEEHERKESDSLIKGCL